MATLSFINYLRGIYDLNLNNTSEVHKAVIESIHDSFIMSEGDVNQMRLELSIKTATGYWLDCWGDYFAVQRKLNESDDEYSSRIIASVISPKSTIPALKDHIVTFLNTTSDKNYTPDDVKIVEPWTQLSKYSHVGKLNDNARLFSSDYYCHAVIDITIPENVTKDLIDLVKSVKAAGVKAVWSSNTNWDIVTTPIGDVDAYADYTRNIQTHTSTITYSGLVLSNTSAQRFLSGRRNIWRELEVTFYLKALIKDRDADTSRILTKKDLFSGLLDSYSVEHTGIDTDISDNYVVTDTDTNYVLASGRECLVRRDYLADSLRLSYNRSELSDDNKLSGDIAETYTYEIEHKVTDEMLDTLNKLDNFVTLNKTILNSKEILLTKLDEHDLYSDLCRNLQKWKSNNEDYYNSTQPPISVTDKTYTAWYVRNDTSIWNSIAVSYNDLYECWEGDKPEYTDYTALETLYRRENTLVGDRYQPKLMTGEKQYAVAKSVRDWLFNSDIFCIEDLNEVYSTQFRYVMGISVPYKEECTLEEIMLLEETHNYEGYSVAPENAQSMISVETTQ